MTLSDVVPGWWYSDGHNVRHVQRITRGHNGNVLVHYLDDGRPPMTYEHGSVFVRWARFRAPTEMEVRAMVDVIHIAVEEEVKRQQKQRSDVPPIDQRPEGSTDPPPGKYPKDWKVMRTRRNRPS